jgi:hypothetical protein
VLPNFGNNFVKYGPIFKILSLLERELNLKQNSHNMFNSSCLKKIYNCHISRILILHNPAQFKLDASGNVTIQQIIDIFTSFVRNVPHWPTHKLEYDYATRQLHCQQTPVPYRAKRPTNVASVQ